MMAFRKRAADKAQELAGGGAGPPAGQDPQVPGEPATPAVADRGAMRKRLRRTRRTRNVLLHELGALVMEMHRQGKHDPALVERKAREAIAVDAEARTLSGALGRGEPLASLRDAGVAGPCASCGALLVRDDRFCNRCGAAAGALTAAAAEPPSGAVSAPRPSEAARVDAPPPSGPDRVDAPPPAASDLASAAPPKGDPLSAPPPSEADRVSDGGDGVPTYRVTTR